MLVLPHVQGVEQLSLPHALPAVWRGELSVLSLVTCPPGSGFGREDFPGFPAGAGAGAGAGLQVQGAGLQVQVQVQVQVQEQVQLQKTHTLCR